MLCAEIGFDPALPVGVLIFHPVLQEAGSASEQIRSVLRAAEGMQVLALMPNSDAGSDGVRQVLSEAASFGTLKLRTHLRRHEYIGWLACCDVLFGNSSSGIIEAASFGTPVVNIGTRQNLRERNANIQDVSNEVVAIAAALKAAISHGRYPAINVYGDGQAGRRIVELLATKPLTPDLLDKCNVY
jgi:GDP/UDP-N,N'-diacetylbacillosamine 2-epimerase (hydrolysing)